MSKKPWKLLHTLAANELRQAARAVGEATQVLRRLRQQLAGLLQALEQYKKPDEEAIPGSLLRNTDLFKKKLAAAVTSMEQQVLQAENARDKANKDWAAAKAKKDGFEKLDQQAILTRSTELSKMQDKAAEDAFLSARATRQDLPEKDT